MASRITYTNLTTFPGTKKPIPGGLKGVNVNTKYFKDELSSILEINPADPGAWHENAAFEKSWARHMTAEVIDEKGRWVNPQEKDNHLWDCAVLCLVGHEILGVETWPEPSKENKNGNNVNQSKAARGVRSQGVLI